MSRSGKLTTAEDKLKKKEYDRKRREKLKNCPECLEKLREKERLNYLKKKEKCQVKSITAMSSRERRQKRKQWRINSLKYREKNKNVRKNLARLINETPPASPVLPVKPSSQVNAVKIEKCPHFYLGYYKTSEISDKDTPAVSMRRKRKDVQVENYVKISQIIPSGKSTYEYKVDDHVLITWNNEVYPGQILSLSNDGTLVRCMKRGSKCWKWPTVRDEKLYAWRDVLRIIEPPKLLSRDCYFVKEVDERI